MKLTKGPGSPTTGGCWMVAAQRYTENSGWHDHPECVDPAIRGLCIWVNDNLPDGARERVIGPHLFAPVGTANPALAATRLRRVVQFALDEAGVAHTLPPEPRAADYSAAAEAAEAAEAAGAAGAARAARSARSAGAAGAAWAAWAARSAAVAAAWAAGAAGAARAARAAGAAEAAEAAAEAAEHRVLPLILELCAMSTPVEVCPVRTKTEVLRTVCRVTAD